MALTDRYVSSSGTDTYANSTNPSTPMSLATALTNAAAGDRINVKADGTYTRSANATPTNDATQTSPIIWRGYSTTIGDGDQGRSLAGALVTTNMPLIAFDATFSLTTTKAFTIWESIRITATVSGPAVTLGNSSAVRMCHITNASTNSGAIAISSGFGLGTVITDCDLALSGASGGNCVVSVPTVTNAEHAGPRIVGNRVKTTAASCPGIIVVMSCTIVSNTIFNCSIGISITSATCRPCILYNTITGNAGDGIDIVTSDRLQCIIGNMITDNGGFGIDCNSAAASPFLAYNRTRDNTSGATNLGTNWVLGTSFEHVTTDTGGPETDYEDDASDDYRLITASPAINTGFPSSASIGALQPESGVGASESSHAFVG